jgi:hypothetical protein
MKCDEAKRRMATLFGQSAMQKDMGNQWLSRIRIRMNMTECSDNNWIESAWCSLWQFVRGYNAENLFSIQIFLDCRF